MKYLALALLLAQPLHAELSPANGTVSAKRSKESAQIALPIGAWSGETLRRITLEGAVTETAWRIPFNELPPLELLKPLRNQLEAEGYRTLYECAAAACGGYDFRYATPLLAEPEMHVDLANYIYYLGSNGTDYTMILASRSIESGFVQVTQVPQALRRELAEAQPAAQNTAPAQGVAQQLEQQGFAPLDDLQFEPSSATLKPADYASLQALAAYLIATPQARVALVGHTDTSGALAANIALSKARAEAVRQALTALKAPKAQIAAEGAGWLAPRYPNTTPESRAKNRRVEVVLTSTPVK